MPTEYEVRFFIEHEDHVESTAVDVPAVEERWLQEAAENNLPNGYAVYERLECGGMWVCDCVDKETATKIVGLLTLDALLTQYVKDRS